MNTKYVTIQIEEPSGDFYKRVKSTLPCNMDEWSDEQVRAQYVDAKPDFYKEMIEAVAARRGLTL